MTGFSRSTKANRWGKFIVELRSLNHRYLDIQLRLPPRLLSLEPHIQELIKEQVRRGKVEFYLGWAPAGRQQQQLTLNVPLLEAFHEQMHQLCRSLGIREQITPADLLTLPQAVSVSNATVDLDALWKELNSPVRRTLEQLVRMRRREGRNIQRTLNQILRTMARLIKRLQLLAPRVSSYYQRSLKRKLGNLQKSQKLSLDQQRLEMEVALLAERTDISEEIERLRSHLQQFQSLIRASTKEPKGKALDFLCQELQREANTITAKAKMLQALKVALALKNEIEKLREQVQNIE